MREAASHVWIKLDLTQCLRHPHLPFLPAQLRLMHLQALADNLLHGQARRKRRKGVLEDYLHVAAQRAELAAAQAGEQDVVAVVTKTDFPLKRTQTKQAKGKGAFAGARLTDDPQRRALADAQADLVHRLELADLPLEQPLPRLFNREGTAQPFDADQRPATRNRLFALLRDGGQQPSGVVLFGRSKDGLRVALLDNPALVHN